MKKLLLTAIVLGTFAMNGIASSIPQTPRSPFLRSVSRTTTPSTYLSPRLSTPFPREILRTIERPKTCAFSRLLHCIFPCCFSEPYNSNTNRLAENFAGVDLVPHRPNSINLNEQSPFDQMRRPIPSPDLLSQQPSLSQTPIELKAQSPVAPKPRPKARKHNMTREMRYVSQNRTPGTTDGYFTRSTPSTAKNIKVATQKQIKGQPVLSPLEQELLYLGFSKAPDPTTPRTMRSSGAVHSKLGDSLKASRAFHDKQSGDYEYYD